MCKLHKFLIYWNKLDLTKIYTRASWIVVAVP